MVMEMLSPMKTLQLAQENCQFAGTGGVSANNADACFAPAFMDFNTGQIELSRFQDGSTAPYHLIDGLPRDWVIQRDVAGKVLGIRSTVVSGFVRLGKFFTREEAAGFIEQLYDEAV